MPKRKRSSSSAGRSRKKRAVSRAKKRNFRKRVLKVIGSGEEKKYVYHDYQDTSCPDTGTLVGPFTNIAQGDDMVHRDGNNIYLRGLEFTGRLYFPDSSNNVRIMFFQWHPDHVADPPAISNLLQDTSNVWFGEPPKSYVAKRTREKYTILFDRIYWGGTGSGMRQYIPVKFRFSLRNKKMWFRDSSGTSGAKGNIYCLLASDSIGAPHPQLNGGQYIRWGELP